MHRVCSTVGAMGLAALVWLAAACKEQQAQQTRKGAKSESADVPDDSSSDSSQTTDPSPSDCSGSGLVGARLQNGCDPAPSTSESAETSTATSDEQELLKQLVNPPELDVCLAQGKLFDRTKQACHKSKLASSYECTNSGVIKAFRAIEVDITLQTTTWLADGYELDQCGELAGQPVVFYLKKSDLGEPKVLVKKICKVGSAACGS